MERLLSPRTSHQRQVSAERFDVQVVLKTVRCAVRSCPAPLEMASWRRIGRQRPYCMSNLRFFSEQMFCVSMLSIGAVIAPLLVAI